MIKTIKVTEINAYKKANPKACFFAKCGWGDWEVEFYDGSWLRRKWGMGLCVTPDSTVEVLD